MRKFIPLVIAIAFLQQFAFAQTTAFIQVFKRDTAFKSIAIDTNRNIVFAGTGLPSKGLVKYDQRRWSDWNGAGVVIKNSYLRQLAILPSGNVAVASSGYVLYLGGSIPGVTDNPGNNNNFAGGIYNINSNVHINRTYFRGRPVLGQQNPLASGPPTRNILGVYVDSTGRPWCVGSYQDSVTYPLFLNYNSRYHFVPGAVGRFNGSNYSFITGPALPDPTGILLGVGNNYVDENASIGKRRTCRSITQVGTEMWVGSDGYESGGVITPGILRYSLDGSYIGKYDQNNTPVPFGTTNTTFGPWAMCKDSKGNAWIAMNGTKGIAVRDSTGVWVYVGVPPNLPAATIFRPNSIACGKKGEVYFGTNNGLLEYKGKGAFNSDTSYKVYTTANGLSTNSIFSIAVGKDQSVWMATDLGINKLVKGDLVVYNRKPNKVIFTDNDLFRTKILQYNSQDNQENIDKDTLLIAADGGKATIFKWTGATPQNMKFRFVEDPNGQNVSEFGSFSIRHQNNDSLRVLYNHPKYLDELYTVGVVNRDVHLQVIDSTQNPVKVLISVPVKFVLPPVLMIHGVWSSTSSFKKMEDYLLASASSKNYKPYSLLKIWYPTDNHPEPVASQAGYKYEIPNGIDRLIENCALNKMSAGRVDILGHSRGGIFARIYLQETFINYRKDINKLITINTPHWGAQTANLVLDKRKILLLKNINPLTIPPILVIDSSKTFGEIAKGPVLADVDDINGAVELKVNSTAISQSLNGPANINKNTTYSHALVGRYLFSQQPTTPQGLIIGNFTFGTRFLQKLISIPTIDSLMSKLFNGENNDIVVPVSSQQGGLAETYTSRFTENIAHSNKTLPYLGTQFAFGVLDAPVAQARVAELLRKNPEGGLFATDGFNAPATPLQYTLLKPNPLFLTGTSDRTTNADDVSIKIDPLLNGTTYNAGDTVFVKVFKQNTDTTLIKYSNKVTDIYSDEHFGNDTLYKFPIPLNTLGALNIEVYGFGSGKTVYDACTVFVNLPTTVSLDSIKISHPAINNLTIPLADSTNITVYGYYNDGVKRNITYQPGLTYSTLAGSVSTSSQGYVKGLILGFDELRATYLGKVDSTYLEVVAKPVYDTVSLTVLPVRFLSINASYNGANIMVNWATAFELNNHHFEIEYSKNGMDFINVGNVNATNNGSGAKYDFIHKDFVIGKNYYRIKQVDNDGTVSYSNIVISIISEKNNVILYPNPVNEVLVIDFIKAPINFKKGTIIIINSIGQIIQQQIINTTSSKAFINTSELAAGIYNIQIIGENNKQLWVERFIKNK
jgi:pimeloyl-ACP methyl ester carboxylesterase